MTRQMQIVDEALEPQAAHHCSKQSPRVKNRQAPSIATPVTKKALEYAGPSFNHSPAPANLPPPPFLSKLGSQDSPSGPPRKYMPDAFSSSPPVFDSNLDTSIQRDRMSKFKAAESTYITFKSEHNQALVNPPVSEDTSITAHDVVGEVSDHQGNASKREFVSPTRMQDVRNPSSRLNPWTRDQAASQHVSTASSSSDFQRNPPQIAAPTTRKPAAASESRRRKGKASKMASAESVPRAILRRPPQISPSQPPQTGAQHGHSQANRSKSESIYVPLQRQPLTSEACTSKPEEGNDQAELQEEELLRLQTSQLMSLLEIQPDNCVPPSGKRKDWSGEQPDLERRNRG